MKKIFFMVSLFVLLSPLLLSAHVKWFAEPIEPVRSYSITDGFVLAWIVIAFALILVGVFLEKKISLPKNLLSKLYNITPIVCSLSSVGFGVSLIIFTLNGFVFAPNIPVWGNLGAILLLLQGVSGLLILFGFYERVGAILLFLVFSLSAYMNGLYEMVDALEILGFSIYLLIVGRPKWRLVDTRLFSGFVSKIEDYGVPLLRVFTGLNLVALGFTEKILAPSLTQSFLELYKWNFMQAMGFSMFTDYWFAFSAGVAEVLLGVFLVLGLVTRFTTLCLALFLITTLVLLGPVELIGHLPHFSIAIVFLVVGSGNKLRLIKEKQHV